MSGCDEAKSCSEEEVQLFFSEVLDDFLPICQYLITEDKSKFSIPIVRDNFLQPCISFLKEIKLHGKGRDMLKHVAVGLWPVVLPSVDQFQATP